MKKYFILLATLIGYTTYLLPMEETKRQISTLEHFLAIPLTSPDEKTHNDLTRKITRYILDDQKLWHKQNYTEKNALHLLENTNHNLSLTTQEHHLTFHAKVMVRCHRGWTFKDCWNSTLTYYANSFIEDDNDIFCIGIWDTSTCKDPELLYHNQQLEQIAFCYNDTALIAKECEKETYWLWQQLRGQQILLYILLQKFILLEKPPKNITHAGNLLCHIASRLSLNSTQLREIWATLPHDMQIKLWGIFKKFIASYGK